MSAFCQCATATHASVPLASVFAYGVPNRKDAKALVQELFSQAGRIFSVRACPPRQDAQTKHGFAFIEFTCAHGAYAAVLLFDGAEFCGCRLQVRLAENGLRTRLQPTPWSLEDGAAIGTRESSIYLANARALSRTHLFAEVSRLVKPLGPIKSIKINWNPYQHVWNTFVYSSDPSFAERAVSKLKGISLLGSAIDVGAFKPAKSKPVAPPNQPNAASSQLLCQPTEAERLHQRELAVSTGVGVGGANPLLANKRANQRLKRICNGLAELLRIAPIQAYRALLMAQTEPPAPPPPSKSGAAPNKSNLPPSSMHLLDEVDELELNYRLLCAEEQFARSSDLLAAHCTTVASGASA